MLSLTQTQSAQSTTTRSTTPMADTVTGAPRFLLRLEGALVLAAATTVYGLQGGDWLLYALLFLTPDLFMLGYLRNTWLGAYCYNIGHSYIVPGVLCGLAFLGAQPLLASLALIWIAHIGFDRAVGYGLKYPDRFTHTHLG